MCLAVLALLLVLEVAGAQVVHDMSTGSLDIAGNSTDDYIITGTTNEYYVRVQPGYHGTITLRNVRIDTWEDMSPITIHGDASASNFNPISNVNIVLEGTNRLNYGGKTGAAGIQVDYGAQINISAIDPRDNSSGTLTIWQAYAQYGGAGIGARHSTLSPRDAETQVRIRLDCAENGIATIAGGNIVISSGTITTRGGHGAGIGGGYGTYYDGMIVIYGGVVKASSGYHAAGIGGGCPTNEGVIDCAAPNSAIIVLPPSQITAIGAGSNGDKPVQAPDLALAGSHNIVYVGDPKKPQVTVRTEDYKPYADIYADLSQNAEIAYVIGATVPPENLDIHKVKFGTTDESGIFTFRGILQDATTFFTDARSSSPATYGRPYLPTTTTLTSGGTVVLPIMSLDLTLESFPADVLMEYYSKAEAKDAAFCVKLTYNDAVPMTNVMIDLANGSASEFEDIIFLAADSVTQIAMPTALQKGDVYYMIVPIREGKTIGIYFDVLRLIGECNGLSTGYIRSVIKQSVAIIEEEICDGETYVFDGKAYDEAGIYRIPYIDMRGNESTVRLELAVHPAYHLTETLTLCQSELPYMWQDTVFDVGSRSNTYTFEHTTIHGCDSVVTLDVLVFPTFADDEYVTLCSSELPYVWRDTVFGVGTTSEAYTFERKTIHGCDSVVTLHLTVHPAYNDSVTLLLCPSELPYTWRDTVFEVGSMSGEYIFRHTTLQGCDSIVTLNVIVPLSYNQHETLVLCEDELPYRWRDTVFDVGITNDRYTFERTSIYGCDSLVTLELIVYPSYHQDEYATLCPHELPYRWRDTTFEVGTMSGLYDWRASTIHGCDSIVTLHLTVYPSCEETEILTLCQSELPYTWRDTTFEVGTRSGEYVRYHTTIHGCDSILRLQLTVNDTSVVHIYDSVYVDSTYTQYGFRYSAVEDIDYTELTQALTSVHGCDSTVTLHLRILPPPFSALLSAIEPICADQQAFDIPFSYAYVQYHPTLIEVIFGDTALQAGFSHCSTTEDVGYISVELPTNVVPNTYDGVLRLRMNRFTQQLPFRLMVRYSSAIIEQHWNDLLALRNETLNGGFTFEAYQWYKNGQALAEETKSYLYVGPNDVLDMTAEYSVEIRRVGEAAKIFTCPVIPIPHTDVQPYPTLVEALGSMQLPIQRNATVEVYTLMGCLLLRQSLTPENNTLVAPSTVGVYVVRVTENGMNSVTYKMMVQ